MPAPDARSRVRDAARRARRAVEDVVDRARDARVLAVVLALCVLAGTNPSAESFHAACVEGAFVERSTLDALTMRARGRVCSNYGLARALRLRKPTYGVHDLVIASVARTRRDARHYVGALGAWTRVPKALNFIPTVLVNVYRVHATVLALVALGALGALAVRALRLIKTVVFGVAGVAATAYAAPRACDAPLWSIALCVAMWGYAYKKHYLDGVVGALKALKPPPKHRRGGAPPPPPR